MSDTHIDSRYAISSEANCSQYLCCRPYSTNTQLHTIGQNASVPASRFGYLYCDSPPDLAISAFSAMPQFVNKSDITFTIFTGDLVSHDNADQLSRAYVEYEENVTYALFKAEMGNAVCGPYLLQLAYANMLQPVYATLGNHDSFPEAYNTPNSINGGNGSANAFSWNYNVSHCTLRRLNDSLTWTASVFTLAARRMDQLYRSELCQYPLWRLCTYYSARSPHHLTQY